MSSQHQSTYVVEETGTHWVDQSFDVEGLTDSALKLCWVNCESGTDSASVMIVMSVRVGRRCKHASQCGRVEPLKLTKFVFFFI